MKFEMCAAGRLALSGLRYDTGGWGVTGSSSTEFRIKSFRPIAKRLKKDLVRSSITITIQLFLPFLRFLIHVLFGSKG